MFFGFVVLFDDVVGIVKFVVVFIDDIGVVVVKVGMKVVGVVIDDIVVMLIYVIGFMFDCELLIIWKIVVGLMWNKMLFLLFVVLLFSVFVLFLIMLILMIGGVYLCFEGVEKVIYVFMGYYVGEELLFDGGEDYVLFEEVKVVGVICMDFILLGEIMVIVLVEVVL